MSNKSQLKTAFDRLAAILAQGADPSLGAEVAAAWLGTAVRSAAIAGRVNDWLQLPDEGNYLAATDASNDAADALRDAGDAGSTLAALELAANALGQVERI